MVDEVQVNSSATSAAYFDICEHCEQRITQQFATTVELIRSFLSSGQYVVLYWSASPNANNSNNAWQLNFNNGNDNNNNRNNNNHVRLVRSGQWFSWERIGVTTGSAELYSAGGELVSLPAPDISSLRFTQVRMLCLGSGAIMQLGLSLTSHAN